MVCYLRAAPSDIRGVQDAMYYTSSAELQRAFKLRDSILHSSMPFDANRVQELGFNQSRIAQNMLLVSAPLMQEYALKYCHGGYLDATSCRWYHESWQYLRLLDMVEIPRLHESFFFAYLAKLAETSESLDILVCGLADYEMFAVVSDSIGESRGRKHKITVLDICETPLRITEWYAQQRKVKVITQQADARQTGFPAESFDVIVTDAFLTKLPEEEQRAVISEWHRILKREGRVLTTVKLGGDSTDGIWANEDQIQRYAEQAESLAIAKQNLLGLDPLKIRNLAELYAKKNISYPVKNEDELRALFEGFEITVVSVKPVTEYAVTNYAQVVAVKLA